MHPFLQHHCNPLHVYCRLKWLGLSDKRAKSLAFEWSRFWGWVRKPWREKLGLS